MIDSRYRHAVALVPVLDHTEPDQIFQMHMCVDPWRHDHAMEVTCMSLKGNRMQLRTWNLPSKNTKLLLYTKNRIHLKMRP